MGEPLQCTGSRRLERFGRFERFRLTFLCSHLEGTNLRFGSGAAESGIVLS